MLLYPVQPQHIEAAITQIELQGISNKDRIWSNYWIVSSLGQEHPFKYVIDTASKLATGEVISFNTNQSYLDYVRSLGFVINYYEKGYSFFEQREIEHFANIAGTRYRKTSKQNKTAARKIIPLVQKMNSWAKNVSVEDFVPKLDQSWQISGHFKNYIWIRLYRKQDSKKVFFILAVGADGLSVRIDCWRSNHTMGSTPPLPPEKVAAFDKYLKTTSIDTKHQVLLFITPTELKDYNWDKLLAKTQQVIGQYVDTYDDLEKIINTPLSNTAASNQLTAQAAPTHVPTRISDKRNYTGKKYDWKQIQTRTSNLGLAGELLVLEIEKAKLTKLGMLVKAGMVKKVLDGSGYDILSFDEQGEEMHIEVKTTTGSINEPFYMSLNEKCYLRDFPDKYHLYRLYNYHFISNSAKLFKLSADDLKNWEFTSINFEVSSAATSMT